MKTFTRSIFGILRLASLTRKRSASGRFRSCDERMVEFHFRQGGFPSWAGIKPGRVLRIHPWSRKRIQAGVDIRSDVPDYFARRRGEGRCRTGSEDPVDKTVPCWHFVSLTGAFGPWSNLSVVPAFGDKE